MKAYTIAENYQKTFAMLYTLPPEENGFTVFVSGPYGPSGWEGVKICIFLLLIALKGCRGTEIRHILEKGLALLRHVLGKDV